MYNFKYKNAWSSWGMKWARAGEDKTTGTLVQLQQQVSCKDYIVDTFFRPQMCASWQINVDEAEIAKTVWFIIRLEEGTKKALENLKFLNKYEEEWSITQTEVVYDGKTKCIWIKPDPIWTSNACLISVYLSIVRMTIIKGDYKTYINVPYGTKHNHIIGEDEYLNRSKESSYAFIVNTFLNPLNMLKYWTKDTKTHGYVDSHQGHGTTGLFYWSNMFDYHSVMNNIPEYIKTHFWTKMYKAYKDEIKAEFLLLQEKLKKEKKKDVKVPSVQPKIKRTRAKKKVEV